MKIFPFLSVFIIMAFPFFLSTFSCLAMEDAARGALPNIVKCVMCFPKYVPFISPLIASQLPACPKMASTISYSFSGVALQDNDKLTVIRVNGGASR